jgi:V/A-type H+-transporting ATPase subunit D
MATDNIEPTRSGLLIVRRRIALADRTHRLLKMKLDGMMLELVRLVGRAVEQREHLEKQFSEAREMVAVASMMEGATGVLLAALSVEESPTVTTGQRNIFGVRLPELEPEKVRKTLDERGYGVLGTSSVIDDAADIYEDLLEDIIKSAELEGGINRLLQEIVRTRRRVNALEFKVIPDLIEVRRFIEHRRDEMEREERTRLVRVKKIKARRSQRPIPEQKT